MTFYLLLWHAARFASVAVLGSALDFFDFLCIRAATTTFGYDTPAYRIRMYFLLLQPSCMPIPHPEVFLAIPTLVLLSPSISYRCALQ